MEKDAPIRRRRPRPFSVKELRGLRPLHKDDPIEAWDERARLLRAHGDDRLLSGEDLRQQTLLADEILEELFADEANMQPDKAAEIVRRHKSKNPARRRKRSRRRNPITRSAVAIGLGVAGLTAAGIYLYRRRAKKMALEAADSGIVTGPDDKIVAEPGITSNKPKPTTAAKLPAELLAGGAPLEPGWKTVAWYTYPEGQRWIRIDEYGDAIFKEDPPSWFAPTHTGTIVGRWRWVVIMGAATPQATGELNGTYKLERNAIYNRYDLESAQDTMRWAASKRAAEWIDTAYGLGN